MIKKWLGMRLLSLSLGAVIFAALAVGKISAADTDDLLPSKQYLRAHEALSTAEWLAKRDMNEDAAGLYKEALRLFQQVSADYPQWQTNLVAFRINCCREGLDQVRNPKPTEFGLKKTADPVVVPPSPQESLRTPGPPQPSGADPQSGADAKEAARLEKTGDLPGALSVYKAILTRNKQNAAALGGAARCLLKLGKVDEAREMLFQWSVIPSPDNGVNLLLALIFSGDRQYAKAIQLADIVINEDASSAAAHVVLGVALAGMGQTRKAISEMNKAVTLDPTLNEAHYNLALLVLKKEPAQTATAKAHYLNALKFGAASDPDLAKRLQK